MLALESRLFAVYQYLWGEDFINLWSQADNVTMLAAIKYLGLYQLIETHLTSPVATNIFLSMPVQKRSVFVREIFSRFDGSYEIQKALTSKYYAPHFLLMLTERDTFMRMTDFALYNDALANSSNTELDEVSKTNLFDEQFMRFLRYVTMLDQTDPKQREGQKLVDIVYGLDKFQGYKNQSL